MSAVLVDSNVLLDVLTDDPRWGGWSSDALSAAADSARLVINPVVFAEVSVRYSRIEDLEAALPPDMIGREHVPWAAAFLAAKAHLAYRQRGGAKSTTLPDFFIGANAAVAGYRLLTRDRSRFASYFPTLELIAP
jgi:predicted nucleic acid-binding protein